MTRAEILDVVEGAQERSDGKIFVDGTVEGIKARTLYYFIPDGSFALATIMFEGEYSAKNRVVDFNNVSKALENKHGKPQFRGAQGNEKYRDPEKWVKGLTIGAINLDEEWNIGETNIWHTVVELSGGRLSHSVSYLSDKLSDVLVNTH